jgi:hypothetical protein
MALIQACASEGLYWWDSSLTWAINAAFVPATIVVSCYWSLLDAVAIITRAAMFARILRFMTPATIIF